MSFSFKHPLTIEQIHHFGNKTIATPLGIEFVEVGTDFLIARMPVDARTHQPYGILHGGASVVLAETLGSIASQMMLDPTANLAPVGVEINANHLRPVASGWVYGKVTPIHVGKKLHVWDIKISDEHDKLVCISRLTVMVIEQHVRG